MRNLIAKHTLELLGLETVHLVPRSSAKTPSARRRWRPPNKVFGVRFSKKFSQVYEFREEWLEFINSNFLVQQTTLWDQNEAALWIKCRRLQNRTFGTLFGCILTYR